MCLYVCVCGESERESERAREVSVEGPTERQAGVLGCADVNNVCDQDTELNPDNVSDKLTRPQRHQLSGGLTSFCRLPK